MSIDAVPLTDVRPDTPPEPALGFPHAEREGYTPALAALQFAALLPPDSVPWPLQVTRSCSGWASPTRPTPRHTISVIRCACALLVTPYRGHMIVAEPQGWRQSSGFLLKEESMRWNAGGRW